ncbi:MAG: hypothetical protein K2W96_05670 [Gemmataceae bacterium]|nr:hypothetical protein [Gemmataceae bacterium]
MDPVLIGTFAATAEDGQRCGVRMWMTFRPYPAGPRDLRFRWQPESCPSLETESGHEVCLLLPSSVGAERFLAIGPELVLTADASTASLLREFVLRRQERIALDG